MIITIDAAPPAETLRHLWQQFEEDPLRAVLLADTSTFLSARHFIAAVGQSIIPFVASVDGEPAGISWLYNIAMAPPKMTPISAFTAGYVLPQFRDAHLRRECNKAYISLVQTYGIEHLWAEVRTDNLAAHYALRASGFKKTALLPSWKRYKGQWKNMILYHLPILATFE